MGPIETIAVTGIFIGMGIILIGIIIFAFSDLYEKLAFNIAITGIVLLICCLIAGPLAAICEDEEKPKDNAKAKVTINKKSITVEQCRADRFCEVEKLTALRICNSNGCKIVKDTILVIESEDF